MCILNLAKPLCRIFSISAFNKFYLPNILNRLKRERTVIFIKYIATVIFLVFPPKTLISSKIMLPASNLLKVLELVENELEKTFFRKYLAILFFASDLSKLKVNVLEANN